MTFPRAIIALTLAGCCGLISMAGCRSDATKALAVKADSRPSDYPVRIESRTISHQSHSSIVQGLTARPVSPVPDTSLRIGSVDVQGVRIADQPAKYQVRFKSLLSAPTEFETMSRPSSWWVTQVTDPAGRPIPFRTMNRNTLKPSETAEAWSINAAIASQPSLGSNAPDYWNINFALSDLPRVPPRFGRVTLETEVMVAGPRSTIKLPLPEPGKPVRIADGLSLTASPAIDREQDVVLTFTSGVGDFSLSSIFPLAVTCFVTQHPGLGSIATKFNRRQQDHNDKLVFILPLPTGKSVGSETHSLSIELVQGLTLHHIELDLRDVELLGEPQTSD